MGYLPKFLQSRMQIQVEGLKLFLILVPIPSLLESVKAFSPQGSFFSRQQ
jgi:hypothetical protein